MHLRLHDASLTISHWIELLYVRHSNQFNRIRRNTNSIQCDRHFLLIGSFGILFGRAQHKFIAWPLSRLRPTTSAGRVCVCVCVQCALCICAIVRIVPKSRWDRIRDSGRIYKVFIQLYLISTLLFALAICVFNNEIINNRSINVYPYFQHTHVSTFIYFMSWFGSITVRHNADWRATIWSRRSQNI